MRYIIALNSILFLAVANFSVFQKEELLRSPDSVVLSLAPVDPRSLIQGDYMRIRYAASVKAEMQKDLADGFIFVKQDKKGVHQFSSISGLNGNPKEGEIKIRFRKRGSIVRIGAESFFFQEGDAKFYENAKYGLLKVSPAGDVLLAGLMDEKMKLIVPQKKTDLEHKEEN